ncbi:MAG TPA: undecaprenyl-diphosphate phosphatase [Streptosporangiaceae bacterium]|nr:undecaprenyl-diphosphate phosphatase [Streptosporangiaceae bacterium]
MSHLTYAEAIIVGLIQGVTELFPVSSLGHNVLLPALVGGSWANDLNVSTPESPYLAFIVGLHVATAIGLTVYFWRDWVRIIGGFFTSLRRMEIETADQKLAWMIIFATIPVGLAGVIFEHAFRVLFGVPSRAAIFLVVNGVILFSAERFRTKKSRAADAQILAERDRDREQDRSREPELVGAGVGGAHAAGHRAERHEEVVTAIQADHRITAFGYGQAFLIGSAQILALLAGISRDGVAMAAGMFRGLSREDAARFAFLLATPVILAAGVLKIPDLFGQLGNGIRPQILVGSVVSGIGAYVSVRFLMRYFRTRTLTPFAIYCVIFGLGSLIVLAAK